MRVRLLLYIFLQLAVSTAVSAATLRIQLVTFRLEGSAPPAPGLYACGKQLEGQLLDESKAKDCLSKLLSSGFFQQGEMGINMVSPDAAEVVFHLKSPELLLTTLDFQLDPQDRLAIERWLAGDKRNLRLGGAYSRDSEATTFYGIQQYFASQGRAVLLTEILRLNYRSSEAALSYKFVEGPRVPQERALPPYASQCKHQIKLLDMTDMDENVPIPLINQITKVRPFSCFDAALLKTDKERLLAAGFLKEVAYSVDKEGQDRNVRMRARAEPLVVQSLDVSTFGQNVNLTPEQIATLPLRSGQFYRVSLANATARVLEQLLQTPEFKVLVVQEATLANGKLHLKFNVLLAARDQIFLDGKEF